MAITRNRKRFANGEFECQKLKTFVQSRNKNLLKKRAIQKLNDPLLSLIYLFLYILAFLYFIALSIGRIVHVDHEPPEYLPIDISCQHILLEAVQRSRATKKIQIQRKPKLSPKLSHNCS